MRDLLDSQLYSTSLAFSFLLFSFHSIPCFAKEHRTQRRRKFTSPSSDIPRNKAYLVENDHYIHTHEACLHSPITPFCSFPQALYFHPFDLLPIPFPSTPRNQNYVTKPCAFVKKISHLFTQALGAERGSWGMTSVVRNIWEGGRGRGEVWIL